MYVDGMALRQNSISVKHIRTYVPAARCRQAYAGDECGVVGAMPSSLSKYVPHVPYSIAQWHLPFACIYISDQFGAQ